MTRCKFTCTSVTKKKGWSGLPSPFIYDAQFQVVTHNSYRDRAHVDRPGADEAARKEDEKFWAASPCGAINVGTMAADHFEVGRDYFVDFTPVPTAGGAT